MGHSAAVSAVALWQGSEQRAETAIAVSGPLTGQPVDASDLRKVAEAVPEVPVLANTGVTVDNVRDILAAASGCVIGTHLKVILCLRPPQNRIKVPPQPSNGSTPDWCIA